MPLEKPYCNMEEAWTLEVILAIDLNKKIVQLIFSKCFHGKRQLRELKFVKRGKTSICAVNKRLKEAKVKFLIERDKKEFKYCIITLYIGKTPDTNTYDTSNELKQVSADKCFYISGKSKTYINFTPI